MIFWRSQKNGSDLCFSHVSHSHGNEQYRNCNQNYVSNKIQIDPFSRNREERNEEKRSRTDRRKDRERQVRSERGRKKPLHPFSSGLRYVTHLESWHRVTRWCQDEWRRKGISCCARAHVSSYRSSLSSSMLRSKTCQKFSEFFKHSRFIASVNYSFRFFIKYFKNYRKTLIYRKWEVSR